VIVFNLTGRKQISDELLVFVEWFPAWEQVEPIFLVSCSKEDGIQYLRLQ